MSLDKIVHRIGDFTRTAAVSGLLGLSILGTGSMPAYAQQNVKYASNVVYVPCTPQQTTTKKEKKENWGELSRLLGVVASHDKNPKIQDVGGLLSDLGYREYQKEVAREGRTRVTVNQEQQIARHVPAPGCAWANPEDPNDFNVRKSLGMAFAANYFRDFNNDKAWSLNEFVGIKDKFYDDESIILVLYNPTKRGISGVKTEIYGPTGEKIYEHSWEKDPYAFKMSLQKRDYGNYMVVWRSQGITETTKFEIVKDPNDFPVKKNDFDVKNIGTALVANYWKDLNNDGRVDINEFVGIKDKFYDNENIFLALHNSTGYEGIMWEIYGPTGEKIEGAIPSGGMRSAYEEYKQLEGYTATNMISVNEIYPDHFTSWLRWRVGGGDWIGRDVNRESFHYQDWKNVDPKEIIGGYGNYAIVWSSEGITEMKKFEIVPASERPEKKK